MEKQVTPTLDEWEAIQEELRVLRDVKAGVQRITIRNWPRQGDIEILNPDEALNRIAEIVKNVQTEAKVLADMARKANTGLYAEMAKNQNIRNHWLLKHFIKK